MMYWYKLADSDTNSFNLPLSELGHSKYLGYLATLYIFLGSFEIFWKVGKGSFLISQLEK